MSVQEVITFYEETIPKIFVKAESNWSWSLDSSLNYLVSSFSDIPLFSPYTQKPLEDTLRMKFDDGENRAMTNNIVHKSEDNTCYAGAVARQFNENITKQDKCMIFDSKSNPPQFVSEVLLATSDAPFYFEIPSKLGLRNFIDGGVGGKYSP